MPTYKIKYHVSHSKIFENADHWIEECILISADSYLDAQEQFRDRRPHYQMSDIEEVGE